MNNNELTEHTLSGNYCKLLIQSVDDARRIHFIKEENAQLKRLLAEACNRLDECPTRLHDELEEWYEAHKQEQTKNAA